MGLDWRSLATQRCHSHDSKTATHHDYRIRYGGVQPLGAIDRSRRNLRISRRRGWLRPGRSWPRSGQRNNLRRCCLQCLRHARSCLEPSVYDHNRRVPRSHQPQVQRKRSSWARCVRESASRQRPRTKVPIWIFTPHHDDASTGRNYLRRYGTRARNAIQQRFLRLVTWANRHRKAPSYDRLQGSQLPALVFLWLARR